MTEPYAIELKGITKRFPLVLANDNINLKVKWGSIHALVGENGAGKSTLMKILYGMQPPTSGEIWVNGQPAPMLDPRDAIQNGIGMVHQHFMLVGPLTVTENVILGMEPTQGTSINYAAARKRVKELIDQFNFGLNPDAKIEDLPVGLQQKVEILKTLYRGAKILILDEPTAVLTPAETEDLFRFLREQFAQQGNSVIFISHKLHEVLELCDEISVLRDGRMIGSIPREGATTETIARMMVGREVNLKVQKKEAQPKEKVLEVVDATILNSNKKHVVDQVSFHVASGEVVGIAGIDGNGQSELVEAITGLRHLNRGEIRYSGETLKKVDARKVAEAGLSHIPEDRNERGLVLDMTTAENMVLGQHRSSFFSGKFGFLNLERIRKHTETQTDLYDVRPRSADLPAGRYSGGNAQKIIVAREMFRNPKILVASQPTRGVDIGAIEFIHRQIVRARDQGLGVLLVSADLTEVMNLSDRILVMFEGQIMGEVKASEATEEQLGLLMAGVKAAPAPTEKEPALA
ncbi:ABC transporter ATP-binding protein [Deinococcus cellulosilyticus]|uniref:Sugar ABC transporter ATP-binding protein n=1 Tax=Deinococcus cellulosilyticus (strain DSM 18568 / NBRC 106333 / KACC 11606 / 5516J-15) TaxID=1223518 RepID=A0A511MVX7_DEIC1|nr:ABC transporter ATP-binding protein [Deinococcus cellulosilyticus]GEM44739.1 sugar ABC transporter ATP-binding protein [Deinococcus cellulosilyticus NBRC 106333 = KACC 11606]